MSTAAIFSHLILFVIGFFVLAGAYFYAPARELDGVIRYIVVKVVGFVIGAGLMWLSLAGMGVKVTFA